MAVINCLSIHKLANVLKEFCLAVLKFLIALNKPIKPSCTMSSLSAPIIKYLLTFRFTKFLYLLIRYSNAHLSPDLTNPLFFRHL